MSKPALIVIDLQNDYFPGGAFPLVPFHASRSPRHSARTHVRDYLSAP